MEPNVTLPNGGLLLVVDRPAMPGAAERDVLRAGGRIVGQGQGCVMRADIVRAECYSNRALCLGRDGDGDGAARPGSA
jgi:hypothetical protein